MFTALLIVCGIITMGLAGLVLYNYRLEVIERKAKQDKDAKFREEQLRELSKDIDNSMKTYPMCAIGHYDRLKHLSSSDILAVRGLIYDIDLARRMGADRERREKAARKKKRTP